MEGSRRNSEIMNSTILVYKTNENCENTTFLEAIKKLTENVNEVIETKNYVNNSCGYTCCFSNGQMAVAGEIFMDTSEQQQNRATSIY